jgi:hypothetical protein
LLGLALAGWLAWQKRFVEAWVMLAGVLLPASTALHSLPRFVATAPFFLFALAETMARLPGRLSLALTFALLALLHTATLGLWLVGANSAY